MNGFYEYVKMAVQNIRANKGRSFLTMLGIIIGIASVIAIVSIGEGTKNQMNSEIISEAARFTFMSAMMQSQNRNGSHLKTLMQSVIWKVWKG